MGYLWYSASHSFINSCQCLSFPSSHPQQYSPKHFPLLPFLFFQFLFLHLFLIHNHSLQYRKHTNYLCTISLLCINKNTLFCIHIFVLFYLRPGKTASFQITLCKGFRMFMRTLPSQFSFTLVSWPSKIYDKEQTEKNPLFFIKT